MKKRLLLALMALLTSSMMWAADGDTFTANIEEDIEITFMVISEDEKTCQVGTGEERCVSLPWGWSPITITIPSTINDYKVIGIGERAFYYCSRLTSITIPDGVKSIGQSAFAYCDGLASITIPDGVTTIGEETFYDCRDLASITIPSSVTSIGKCAFYNCCDLTSITIPNAVTSISEGTFQQCTRLTNITIPNSVTSIDDNAFEGCSKLTDFIIPNSVTNIGGAAFSGCKSLTSITIPNSVTSISGSVFSGCSGLTSITIPNSVTSIGYEAFSYCSSLPSITIPNSVTSIDWSAFQNCSSLTNITIEPGNTTYDSRDNCNGIIETATNALIVGCKNTIIPNGVTYIGDHAFWYCSSLTNINIPSSVTDINWNSVVSYGYAFQGCSSLAEITVDEGNNRYDSRDNCNAIIETATNKLIAGCQNTVIPNSVTSIDDHAFSSHSGLTSITIPSSVKSLGIYAFSGCHGLTSITIPNSVTSIGYGLFYDCIGLTSITIPNSVTSIGQYAFHNCYNLTSITIPSSVTSIGSSAFFQCRKLATVISHIKEPFELDYVFSGIAKNATLYVPAGTKASYQAKSGWNGFTNIKEFNGVTLVKDIETYTSVVALDFTEPIEGLKAYTVSEVTDGKAVLTEVTTAVPAGTGLILKGTAGQTYTIPYTTEEPAAVTNKLVGVTVDTEIGGNDLDYILKDGKFVKASAGTLSAGKAYLKLDAALGRGVVEIDGDVTGVGAALTNSEKVKSEVYNLQGQRVSKPANGLYVVDGKKVFVK